MNWKLIVIRGLAYYVAAFIVSMAGGTFIQGSTIELSADGPLREPYPVFLQGGLNYAHAKYALKKILKEIK